MKKVFIEKCNQFNTVKVFDLDTNTIEIYNVSKNSGFPFGQKTKYTVEEMGYSSIEDAIKQLKKRNLLHEEVDYKQQKSNEKLGYLKLGAERIKRAGRICSTDFEDVINKLKSYGLNYCDAQNQIIGYYEYEVGFN